MKKFVLLLVVILMGISLQSCEYDDTELWNEIGKVNDRVTALEDAVKKANTEISALQTIVNALQNNVYVTNVETTKDGYIIKFSDGTEALISNGKDGINAPVVSVRQDSDGNYYWTLDGEWLLVDGKKIRANGIDGINGEKGEDGEDGEDGKDAITPQVRINPTTKEWEISTDGGQTWTSTGVVAEGKDGKDGKDGQDGKDGKDGQDGKDGNDGSNDSSISLDLSNPEYVIIRLADGSEIFIARYDETSPLFSIVDAPEVVQIEYGKSMEFTVTAKNIADYIINTPLGWKAVYSDNKLTITAPAKDLCHYDKEGRIAITVVSAKGMSAITKLSVMTGEWSDGTELRVLTFEDSDARFEPYTLDYVNNWEGKEIRLWSDLIDNPQYGGPLTYADFMSAMYTWYDQGNTELTHTFPDNYAYCFWGGGHAISNYWGEGFSDEDRDKHIAKYYGEDYVEENAGNDQMLGWFNLQMMVPVPAHSGNNFAVHYGYKDFFSYVENLPEISFADGQARVIDHMYVTNTNYTLNQLYNGVKSEAGNTFGGNWSGLTESAWLKIVASGFENIDDEEPTSEVEFYLVQGENVVTDWQKWDLTGLGNVAKVRFNFRYSEEMGGRYGFTIPGYFAYDDIAVKFQAEKVFK